MGLFGKKTGKTAVFVDYDFWKCALQNVYNLQPDAAEFYKTISEKYQISQCYFFFNFNVSAAEAELEALRGLGIEPVDTRDPDVCRSTRTDFIMLDYIYRTVIGDKTVDTIVLFTSDNRFISVIQFLKNKLKKQVVLCGVKGCLGGKLKAEADNVSEFPLAEVERNKYYDMIVDNFRYIHRHKDRGIYPTFLSTITTVARLNEVEEEPVRAALQELIDKKIVYKVEITVNQGDNTVRVLRLDKGKAIEAGLYVTE